MRIYLTKDQIISIYWAHKNNRTNYSISREIKVPIATVRNCLRYLTKYLSGRSMGRVVTNYLEAANKINNIPPKQKKYMKFFRADQLVQIYKKRHYEHKTWSKIAEEIGSKFQSIASAYKNLENILNGAKQPYFDNYKEAINIIQNEGVTTKTTRPELVEVESPKYEDPFEKLNDAYQKFNDAIGTFVEEIMNKRAAGILTELKTQREINAKLIKTIEEAKNANWITSLKNKFNQ